MPLRKVRKKIGDLLIERGTINTEQLSIALEEQKKKGGYLSQHLIALGFASEMDIAICLSHQYNFAYLPLDNYSVSEDILEIIPFKWIKIYSLLPIDRIGNVLSVVMADPLNEGVIQMLMQITNCEITVFISTYSELNRAINKYYEHKLKIMEETVIDPKDLEKVKTANQFVQTKPYVGQERREFVRLKKELDVLYYYHAKTFQGKTRDISFGALSFVSDGRHSGGRSFTSDVFMPLNTSLACKIILKPGQAPIDVVINVVRVQVSKNEAEEATQEPKEQKYEIGGMFEFIDEQDRKDLLSFITESLKINSK
jgi:hypothetical protein